MRHVATVPNHIQNKKLWWQLTPHRIRKQRLEINGGEGKRDATRVAMPEGSLPDFFDQQGMHIMWRSMDHGAAT